MRGFPAGIRSLEGRVELFGVRSCEMENSIKQKGKLTNDFRTKHAEKCPKNLWHRRVGRATLCCALPSNSWCSLLVGDDQLTPVVFGERGWQHFGCWVTSGISVTITPPLFECCPVVSGTIRPTIFQWSSCCPNGFSVAIVDDFEKPSDHPHPVPSRLTVIRWWLLPTKIRHALTTCLW